MSEEITRKQFHELHWRVVREDPATHFRTGTFAAGLALVDAIGKVADAASRHPNVDLRPDGVTVRMGITTGTFSEEDLELARHISAAARELGAPVDLTGLQMIQVAIDALVIADVLPFWQAVLGYEKVADEDVADPHMEGPPFWFQQMDAPRPQRNRSHIDLYVPNDQAEARVAAAIAAGGRVVRDKSPLWWTLADPEGNEVDVAPWPDQD